MTGLTFPSQTAWNTTLNETCIGFSVGRDRVESGDTLPPPPPPSACVLGMVWSYSECRSCCSAPIPSRRARVLVLTPAATLPAPPHRTINPLRKTLVHWFARLGKGRIPTGLLPRGSRVLFCRILVPWCTTQEPMQIQRKCHWDRRTLVQSNPSARNAVFILLNQDVGMLSVCSCATPLR